VVGSNVLLIKTDYSYGLLGDLLAETPPKNNGNTIAIGQTKYRYNTLGQLIRKEIPDGPVEKYEYNDAGLLEKKSYYYLDYANPSKPTECFIHSIKYVYDNFGRLLSIIPIARNASPYVEYFYDKIDIILSRSDITSLPKDILKSLKNLRSRMVASVNYYYSNKYQVIDLYSYDDDGNVIEKYKAVPGLPLQKVTYSYDIHGKKRAEKTTAGTVNYEKTYNYDSLGRLKEIVPSSATSRKLVSFNYNKFGQLENKKMDGSLYSKYQYSINSQIQNIECGANVGSGSVSKFAEKINYNPDGLINNTRSDYYDYNQTINYNDYKYDYMNRLVDAIASESPDFNNHYTYDDAGRILQKTEGSSNITGYEYYAKTSRLKKANQESANPDYFYDKFGNMVLDKKKNLEIVYDWRNLPVEFNFYNSIPATISAKDNGDYKIIDGGVELTCTLSGYLSDKVKLKKIQLVSSITMLYDAAGNRVLKIQSN